MSGQAIKRMGFTRSEAMLPCQIVENGTQFGMGVTSWTLGLPGGSDGNGAADIQT